MTDAAAWEGAVGRAWATEHRRTERAFAAIGAALETAVASVAPAAGVAIDIGCGVGSSAMALAAARPALSVTGADLSTDLLAVARARAGARANLAFVAGDAVVVAEERAPCDLLVSRHGVMFFADPVAAFARLRASCRAGAPLVFSCFRARRENDWSAAIDTALGLSPPTAIGYAPGPYGFADEAFVADLLARAGWRDVRAVAHDVRYVVGAGEDPVADALGFYRRIGPAAAVLAAAEPERRAAMEARLADLFAARTRDGVVAFTAAIRIWHAAATGDHA